MDSGGILCVSGTPCGYNCVSHDSFLGFTGWYPLAMADPSQSCGWGESGDAGEKCAGNAGGMRTFGFGVGDGSKDRPVPQTRTRWHALVACHTEVLAAHPQLHQQYGLRALLHGGGRVEGAGF